MNEIVEGGMRHEWIAGPGGTVPGNFNFIWGQTPDKLLVLTDWSLDLGCPEKISLVSDQHI